MWQMIKYELDKICSRKIVWIGFLCLLMFHLIVALDDQKYQYQVITPQGQNLEGAEAKDYIREKLEYYAGPLTEEKKDEILRTERAADLEKDSYLSSLWLYLSMEQNFESEYGPFQGQTVENAFTDRGIRVEVGNTQRWMHIFYLFEQMEMLLGFLIVIGVSGVFSEEYIRKTDALLLTSRYGKERCARAKVIASFLFAAIGYVIQMFGTVIPFLCDDGVNGWNAGVQLDVLCGLSMVGYTLNCAAAAVIFFVCGFLAMLLLTAVTLLVSAWSKTPFISIIVAAVLYFMPMFFTSALPKELVCLTPIGASTTAAFAQPGFQIGGMELIFQTKILLITIIVSAAAWVGSRRIFADHQVA